jgi:pimeloyl-ACP methyl ester carboxylesterase
MPTATFKNININYKVQGKGKINVVLLHGFLESLEIWKEYSAALAKSFTVISIDLLGHGKSECIGYAHSMEEMAEAVNAVLKELDVRKAVFVGHSLGGYVTLAFAEKYPDKMKGLCMFNSTAAADSEQKKEDRLKAIDVVKYNPEIFVKVSIPNLYVDPEQHEVYIDRSYNIAMKTPKQGIIAAITGMRNRLSREIILKFVPCKTFYVIGKRDTVIPYEVAIEQAKLNSEGEYYLSEEGGHMCFFEDPKAYAHLNRFVSSCA